jgi:hypothetical protein
MSSPDPDQLARFKEAARQLGADESEDALDRAFGKLDPKAKPESGDDKADKPKGG